MQAEVEIREEQPGDIRQIRALHERAFAQGLEAGIVDALRSNAAVLLSLVAIAAGRLVGHVMYSPASIDGKIAGAALGPMAVEPELQRRGIGSELVRAGNEKLEEAGLPFIIVLGHADFYPRFGFRPAAHRKVTCDWNVPDDAFMLLVLDERRMRGVSGRARYRDEFAVA